MEKQISSDQSPLNDEAAIALINRIEKGDSAALMALYDKTNRLLFGVISRILGDGTPAEETLLSLFTQIWKRTASYEREVPVLEWLVSLARSCAIARLDWSKQGRRKQEPTPAGSPATVNPGRQEATRSAVESLNPLQREILELAYFAGMSCDEIAAQMGKPLGSVKNHARLALSAIINSLQPSQQGETR